MFLCFSSSCLTLLCDVLRSVAVLFFVVFCFTLFVVFYFVLLCFALFASFRFALFRFGLRFRDLWNAVLVCFA